MSWPAVRGCGEAKEDALVEPRGSEDGWDSDKRDKNEEKGALGHPSVWGTVWPCGFQVCP